MQVTVVQQAVNCIAYWEMKSSILNTYEKWEHDITPVVKGGSKSITESKWTYDSQLNLSRKIMWLTMFKLQLFCYPYIWKKKLTGMIPPGQAAAVDFLAKT